MDTERRITAIDTEDRHVIGNTEAHERGKFLVLGAVHVLALQVYRGHQIATVQILDDERLGPGAEFVSDRSDMLWRVRAIGFAQPLEWAEGIRDLELEPVGHTAPLTVGDWLYLAERGQTS